MKETFRDFFPKGIPAPLHRHNFELVSKIKLFPIIGNKQFCKVKEKCTICGKTIDFESWDYSKFEQKKMNDELFKRFLKELDDAPGYVKENTMCYFWHNTSACTKCPKKDCKAREPRELPPKIADLERNDPNEKAEYLVRICDYYTIAIPNPKTHYKLFCDIIRRIGRGEYIKLFFPKENPPVLDDVELENFRKKF